MLGRVRTAAVRLAALEIWPVALGVAAGIVSTRALPVTLVAAAILWPLRWLAHGRLTVRTPADWPIGLLLLTLPVTLWATALPDVTWPQILRLATGIALYYAIVNWTTTAGRLRLLGWGLAAAGLLLAASAPVSVQWIAAGKLTFIPEALYRRLPTLLSDPIHPNVMAGALVILLPIPLAALLFGWRELRWYERVLAVMAGIAMLAVLVLTKSRGGLMGLAAALVALAILRWRRGWLIAPAGVVVATLAVLRIVIARVAEALATTQSLGGLDGRLEVWTRAIFMAQDFPFTGIGMGT